MRRDDDAYHLDMLLAAREIMTLVVGLTFATFERTRMAQLAILKAVETVGEAASHVSADVKTEHPEIPWSGIVGCGIVSCMDTSTSIRRAYGNTVKQDIPRLIPQLERLVSLEAE